MNKTLLLLPILALATPSFAVFSFVGGSDNGTNTSGGAGTQNQLIQGVGYDTQNYLNKFVNSPTNATAQVLWQGLDFSRALNGTNLNSGDKLRIAVYGGSFDRDVPANNPGSSLNLYVSLFQYADQGTGNLPKGAAVAGLQNLAIQINTIFDPVLPTATRFYTASVTLPSALNLSTGKYLMGFSSNTVAGSAAENFLYLNGTPNNTPATNNIALNTQQFRTYDNRAFDGGAFGVQAPTNNRTISVRFEAEPVPEPASMVALGLGALGILRRRRNKA